MLVSQLLTMNSILLHTLCSVASRGCRRALQPTRPEGDDLQRDGLVSDAPEVVAGVDVREERAAVDAAHAVVEYDVVVAARIDLVLKEGVEKTADYQLSGHPARESTYQNQGNERKNGRPGPCIDGEVA